MTEDALLDVDALRLGFQTSEGVGIAVDEVSLRVAPRETLALVGESGCGKSVTALSVLRLLPSPPALHLGGCIRIAGQDVTALTGEQMRQIRGRTVGMIFQEPMTSLNPVFTVGDQIVETIQAHEAVSAREARRRAITLLELVRIPDARKRFADYPHRLSGGMRQRVMIAIAIACNPMLLIADEPTTALDVTVQAQILDLLEGLQRELGMGLLIITHNLGVVAEIADQVSVMYAGRIVEEGDAAAVLTRPRHPYTVGLLGAVPKPPTSTDDSRTKLREIPGVVPSIFDLPQGCAFAARCERRIEVCSRERPPFFTFAGTHRARCFNPVVQAGPV